MQKWRIGFAFNGNINTGILRCLVIIRFLWVFYLSDINEKITWRSCATSFLILIMGYFSHKLNKVDRRLTEIKLSNFSIHWVNFLVYNVLSNYKLAAI